MIMIGENSRLMQRYEVLERTAMRYSAGWAMVTSSWDIKVTLGRHIWQDAQRADRLRCRLKELRSGPLANDNNSGLDKVVNYAASAENISEYIAGMYKVVKADLLEAYHHHYKTTNIALDDATVDLLNANIATLEEQCRWAEGLTEFDSRTTYDKEACEKWQNVVSSMLISQGGIDGREVKAATSAAIIPPREPFERPHEQHLDDIITQRGRDEAPVEEAGEPWREYILRNYFNEIGAGDNVASIVFDAPEHVEWEFLYDMARHCWDEYRHAMMGKQRLTEVGLDTTKLPIGTGVYEFRDRLPLVERFGMIVFLDEVSAFPYKRRSRELLKAMEDEESSDYLAYDICDETRHVGNGHKWLEHLQKITGDKRDRDQLMKDLNQLMDERANYIGTGRAN